MSRIIRACELRRLDIFIKQGMTYIVVGDPNAVISARIESRDKSQKNVTIGSKSQERVELISTKESRKKKCAWVGCNEPHHARGYCSQHYHRLYDQGK